MVQEQALILDVDGTLSNKGELVSSAKVHQLVNLARKYDLQLGLCTGRARPLVQYVEDLFFQQGFELQFGSYEYGVEQRWNGINPYYTNHLFSNYKFVQQTLQQLSTEWMLGFHYFDTVYKVCGEGGLDFVRQKFPSLTTCFRQVSRNQFISEVPWMGMVRIKKERWTATELKFLDLFNPKHELGEIFQASKAKSISTLLAEGVKVLYCGNELSDETCYNLQEVISFHVGLTGGDSATFKVSSPDALIASLEEYMKWQYSSL